MSVYLSVAPPDGFTQWGDAQWERWLREHPWEQAERVCSRGDWAVFLYQLRRHAPGGCRNVEPVMGQLVGEKPLAAQQAEDLRDALHRCRDELEKQPASAMNSADAQFAGREDLEAMVAAARARLGREPSLGDVWAEVFAQLDRVLENAVQARRGIYFGNL